VSEATRVSDRTLVIHPGALGDVLLAVPALRALGADRPGGELVLAAQARIGELACTLGVVDRAVRFERLGLDRLFVDDAAADPGGELARADRVVCWFGARDETFVQRLRGVTRRVVVDRPAPSEGLVWEHLLRTVSEADGRALCAPLRVPDEVSADGHRALRVAGWDGHRPLIVAHPGAGGPAKRWPVEGFAHVIRSVLGPLGVSVVVHEGPADRAPVAALLETVPRLAHLDHPSLSTLAGVLTHARGFIGNDSGVTHLAAAVGTPAIALSTEATLSWRSWSASAETLVVATSRVEPADLAAVQHAVERLVQLAAP
jgi:ADP-heptose:LPS heptosyltransferase